MGHTRDRDRSQIRDKYQGTHPWTLTHSRARRNHVLEFWRSLMSCTPWGQLKANNYSVRSLGAGSVEYARTVVCGPQHSIRPSLPAAASHKPSNRLAQINMTQDNEGFLLIARGKAPFLKDWKAFKDDLRPIVMKQPGTVQVFHYPEKVMCGLVDIATKHDADTIYSM